MSDKSKKKKKKKRRLHIFRWIFLVILLVVIAVAGKLFIDAKTMYDKAKIAKDDAETIIQLVKDENYNVAKVYVNSIHDTIKYYREKLSGPIWCWGSKVPEYGRDFDIACDMLALADEALTDNKDDIFALLSENPLSSFKVGDGYNVGMAVKYLDFAEEKIPLIKAYLDRVRPVRLSLGTDGKIDGYLSEIDALIEKYVAKADELLGIYDKASKYIPLIRTFIGDGEDRMYLLEAQNSAEIRSSGGFPGSMGIIRIDDGILTIGDFTSPYKMLTNGTPASAGITDQEVRLFGTWALLTRDCVCFPDFERSASVIASGVISTFKKSIDGVISLTPIVIQDILGVVGPIELSDGTVLDGTNATRMLQHELYVKYFWGVNIYDYGSSSKNNASDKVFVESADAAMAALFENINLDTILPLLDVFEKNVEKRVIMMWMADPEEEAVIKEYGCSGCINEDPQNPEVGVYYSLWTASKLGWYLKEDITIGDPVELGDGRLQYDVAVKLTSRVSLTDMYYGGSWIFGEVGGAVYGAVYIYAPAGGTIGSAYASNGTAISKETYRGRQMLHVWQFSLYRYNPVTIYFKVTTEKGVTTPLGYNTNPLLQDYWTEEDLARLN